MSEMNPQDREREIKEARRRMAELARMANWVCALIIFSDLPEEVIRAERAKVRQRCEELFPGREELYEMIYESRFDRLWEQFRIARPPDGEV